MTMPMSPITETAVLPAMIARMVSDSSNPVVDFHPDNASINPTTTQYHNTNQKTLLEYGASSVARTSSTDCLPLSRAISASASASSPDSSPTISLYAI